jgi:hypothetical protein
MKGKNKNLVVMIIVAVIVGVAGFFGGIHYQKSQASTMATTDRQFFNGNGQGGRRTMMMQGGPQGQGSKPVSGEIISQDDKSITVKMADGSTKIVVLTDSTTINKSSTGTKSDLKTGEKVTAFGSNNSDGSVTAQMVSLGSVMFRGAIPQGGMQKGEVTPAQNR